MIQDSRASYYPVTVADVTLTNQGSAVFSSPYDCRGFQFVKLDFKITAASGGSPTANTMAIALTDSLFGDGAANYGSGAPSIYYTGVGFNPTQPYACILAGGGLGINGAFGNNGNCASIPSFCTWATVSIYSTGSTTLYSCRYTLTGYRFA